MRSRLNSSQPSVRTGLRCAIYTRKSSEEGLEQEFNSLDAQREACEAYIASQRHEGWSLLPTRYDDGGISGGTLQRPAMQRLLADVKSGRVDLVVVYKVDRLTRSLSDFAKIVEVFDAHGASFVSVTQHFNTTTSIGRLTLNMLLSFAQFEREVTGERIRDKIAASKQKGMWLGGSVALGYKIQDRKLIIDPGQADVVRRIYQAYLDLGTVRLLQKHLAEEGITGNSGRVIGRGQLFYMLQNRIYRGEIAHRGSVYPGEHEAIVDAELWAGVQQRLTQTRTERRSRTNSSHPSLLAGMLTDPLGESMTATHATKAGRRYRYYVSSRLITSTRNEHGEALRVPAAALEKVDVRRFISLLADGPGLLQALRSSGTLPADGTEQRTILAAAHSLAGHWHQQDQGKQRDVLLALQTQIVVRRDEITIQFSAPPLVETLAGRGLTGDGNSDGHDAEHRITIVEPVALRRAGKEMALLVGSTIKDDRTDPSLARLVAKAWALREALSSGTEPSLTAFAEKQSISQSYVTRLVRLAWLAPDIVETILGGLQPSNVTSSALMRDTRIPVDWQDQRKALGFV